MGTRGLVGWVVDGEVKVSYNHWDSYPSYLGDRVFAYVQERIDTVETWKQRVRDVVLLHDEDAPATDELIEKARALGLIDTEVGAPRTPGQRPDLYQCLRGAQGRLDLYEEVGYMVDSVQFAQDSVFCEWAWLVNLDEGVVEVFVGFQSEAHDRGRFAGPVKQVSEFDRNPHAPIALLTAVPFTELIPAADEKPEHVRGLLLAAIEDRARSEEKV